jgi:ABC-type protease/lipase transport system fused ATPase/permease subunit
VRLDEAKLDQWLASALGRHVGYLPQDVELFSGTVGRTSPGSKVHRPRKLSLRRPWPPAYMRSCCICPRAMKPRSSKAALRFLRASSKGIALARALYGEPFLVVLDEPNSNPDSEGEEALTKAIAGVRARGGIAIVIAHRPSALASVDLVLVMIDGRAQFFGPRHEALGKLRRPPAAPAVPFKVVSKSGEVAS